MREQSVLINKPGRILIPGNLVEDIPLSTFVAADQECPEIDETGMLRDLK